MFSVVLSGFIYLLCMCMSRLVSLGHQESKIHCTNFTLETINQVRGDFIGFAHLVIAFLSIIGTPLGTKMEIIKSY